jgi:hypothetical protein
MTAKSMTSKSPIEMFNELVQMGHIVPATIDPSNLMAPTAFISVPTTLLFATPPNLPTLGAEGVKTNAALGKRTQRNSKGKRRRNR